MRLFIYVIMLLLGCYDVKAQPPPPPKPITIFANPAQGLIFGAFFQGASGGTVTVLHDGSRSVTGSLVLASLGFTFSPPFLK
ncbi:MAG: DUF4402 domain-containing protein [Chitinophagaceae bacterium]